MKNILTAFLLALSHVVAFAQTKTNVDSQLKTGAISGCVTIEGEMVIGAIVTVEQGGVQSAGAVTNVDGIYCINELLPGKYDVNIRREGMERKRIRGIEVIAGDTTRANISMEYKELINEPIVKTYPFSYILEPREQSTKKLIAEQIDTVVQTGTVAGRITDKDGEPITGAIVHIDLKGVPQKGMATDIDGNYSMTVAPGTYEFVVLSTGMMKVTVTNVSVTSGQITYQNMKMKKNTITCGLTIVYCPPLVDAGKPGTNKKLSSEQIEQMAW